jgi:hypothetical protein
VGINHRPSLLSNVKRALNKSSLNFRLVAKDQFLVHKQHGNLVLKQRNQVRMNSTPLLENTTSRQPRNLRLMLERDADVQEIINQFVELMDKHTRTLAT